MTIEDDAEWNRFVEAAKHFPSRLSWVGVVNENKSGAVGGGEWVWTEEGNPHCAQEYFASGEYEDAAKQEGEYFGAMVPNRNPEMNSDGVYQKQNIFSMPSFDWKVSGLIVEYQKNLSSTYTLNGWVVSDHPRMKGQGAVAEHFYRGLEEGGSEVPLFSEGTGSVVMPMESNRPAKDLEYGGQSGVGLSRLCIDRYHNGANHVAYMDGSVDSVKLAELWKQKWHKQWKAPRQLPRMPGD